jgi:hypothetical protein
MRIGRIIQTAALVALFALAPFAPGQAQVYPNRPVLAYDPERIVREAAE